MKVLVWAADQGACGHCRLIWPAQALAAQGVDVAIDPVGPVVGWSKPWTGEQPPADIDAVTVKRPDADVVVLQRPARKWWAQIIPLLQAHGVRVVVDIDDDFAHIPAENLAHNTYDPRRSLAVNRANILAACQAADLVTVTTPALAARYGRHGRVRVLPNLVPAAYLERYHADTPILGWTGNVETHPHDLETTGGTIPSALTEHGWTFRVIGTGQGVPERLGLDDVQATNWLPLGMYPQAYGLLGAAIVPLHRSVFNEAKSALKMAEAAALGVPVIASPTADNRRLNALGVGLLAKRPADWARHLRAVLGSADLRAELSARGRDAMRPLTYEGNADCWLHAWSPKSAAAAA